MYADNSEIINQMASAYVNDNIRKVIVTFESGETRTYRLFMSASNRLCYFRAKSSSYGFWMSNILEKMVSFKSVAHPKSLTSRERELRNLRLFKRAFTKMAHKNLWTSLQDGYNRLDVDEFDAFLETNLESENDWSDMWNLLREYEHIYNLDLISENNYKTTTIRSNPPKWRDTQYQACLDNIERHLDNKEDFYYSWRSASYDVSVSGKLGSDNNYRAWLSLEFKNCGNGNYYALINSNTAVFLESD